MTNDQMTSDRKKYRLAALTSHPIQYQGPLFKKIAEDPRFDFSVYFCWEATRRGEVFDAEFGKKIQWDTPILQGYTHTFLKNWSPRPSSEFWGQINFGIVRELARGKYDAVLIFGWNSFTSWLAFLTCFLTRTPILLRGENPMNQESGKSKLKILAKKIILGGLFKIASIFLYIGEENKKFYEFYGVPEHKLIFCPYAVDNERFMRSNREYTNSKQIYEFRKNLGIGKSDVVILFVGKLIEKKRPFDLLEAYEKLITQLPNCLITLLFVGDGALRGEMEEYVHNHRLQNVHFAGFQNQTEIPKFYAASDILVLPSGAGETWGLAVNEAMCFGLIPIVSNLVGCAPDLVKHGENGFIFPLGDSDVLVSYLYEFAAYGAKRESFSKKSFEIIQGYSYDKDIEAILEALTV